MSPASFIAFFSSSLMMCRFAVSSTCSFLPYMNFISTITATSMISAGTPSFTRNSMKSNPVALPIIILGGSPISVPVPPMFDASAWVIRYGTGSTFSMLVIVSVISTVVTLSSMAEKNAVMTMKAIIILHGSPFASLAALIATYSKSPDFLTTPTNIIIPSSTPRVLKSICSMALSRLITLVKSSTAMPSTAAAVLWTFSVTISTITSRNTPPAMICSIIITYTSCNICATQKPICRRSQTAPASSLEKAAHYVEYFFHRQILLP